MGKRGAQKMAGQRRISGSMEASALKAEVEVEGRPWEAARWLM